MLSVASSSPLLQTLAKKKGAEPFPLGQLSMPDKREIVQKELDVFGKKLSDSAFNNQVLILHPLSLSECYWNLFLLENCAINSAPDFNNKERSCESALPAPGL